MHAYPPIVPYLAVADAAAAIRFAVEAFGAELVTQMPRPDGRVMHAELRLNGGMVMLADSAPEHGFKSPEGPVPVGLMVAWPSPSAVDEVFARAVAAGATVVMPPQDMFWGARYGQVRDPFGVTWALSSRVGECAMADAMECPKG